MKAKEKTKKSTKKLKISLKNIITTIFIIIILFDIVIFYNQYIKGNVSNAASSKAEETQKNKEIE